MKLFFFTTFMTTSVCAFQQIKNVNVVQKPKTETFEFYGDIAPLGFFDPLQITNTCDESTLKYMREAELHHGRIAMSASVMLPLLDIDLCAISGRIPDGSDVRLLVLRVSQSESGWGFCGMICMVICMGRERRIPFGQTAF